MAYTSPSAASAPVPPHRGRRQPRRIAEGKQGQAVQEHDGEGEGGASDTTTSANSEDPCPSSYHLYHRLITYPLEEIRLPPAQRQRVDKALHRQKMKSFNATGNAEALMLQASSRPPAAMVGWGARSSKKEKSTTCPPTFFDRHTSFAGMSKKNLLDTMRTAVFMSAVRREEERGNFAANAAAQPRHQPRQSDPTNDTNNLVSTATAAARKWQRLAGLPHPADEHAKPTPAIATIVAAAAATAAAGAAAAASNESEPNPNHHGVSFAPFMAIQRQMRRVRADRAGGAETNRRRQQRKATHPGIFSSKDAKHLLAATVASLGGVVGRRSDQGSLSKAPLLDWTKFIYGEGDDDGLTEHGQREEDSMHVVGLGDMKQAQLDLAAVRERAAIAIPRNSSRRRRVANARIDAILYALIQESLRGGGLQGSWRRGSGEEERAEATTAEEGKQSAKHNESSGVASRLLSNNDVEAVITYVDRDQSGEVDVEELQAAISAARRGEIPDTRLADCTRRRDDVPRLKHPRIHDVFRMLDSNDGGRLSREELANGLSLLSAHNRAEVIQRRRASRKENKEQKDEEYKRRAKVAGFLTYTDSLREEAVRERDFFATEVADEYSFRELLRSICEQGGEAGRDEDHAAAAGDGESDYEHDGGGDGAGNGRYFECDGRPSSRQVCSYDADDGGDGNSHPQTAARQQQLRGRRHRKKKKKKRRKRTTLGMRPTVDFCAQHAHLNKLRDKVLARRKLAAAAAAAAAATTSPAVEEAAAEFSGPEEAEEETEESALAAKPMDEGSCRDSGIDGGGTCDERSGDFGNQSNVDVGGADGRGVGDKANRGRSAIGLDNIVDVGGMIVPSSGGAVSEVAGGCTCGSGGRMTFPLVMRICGEESRGEQRVEFPAAFHEHDGSASDKSQGASRRLGACDNKRAGGGGNARGRRLPPPPPPPPPPLTPVETSRILAEKTSPANKQIVRKSAGGGGRGKVQPLMHAEGPRGRAQSRVRGSVKGTRDTGVGEGVVEKQRQYALSDRYLRVYLQRPFEQERLPMLFAAQSSKSTMQRYTVANPYEMTRKQAAQIPRLV